MIGCCHAGARRRGCGVGRWIVVGMRQKRIVQGERQFEVESCCGSLNTL